MKPSQDNSKPNSFDRDGGRGGRGGERGGRGGERGGRGGDRGGRGGARGGRGGGGDSSFGVAYATSVVRQDISLGNAPVQVKTGALTAKKKDTEVGSVLTREEDLEEIEVQ